MIYTIDEITTLLDSIMNYQSSICEPTLGWVPLVMAAVAVASSIFGAAKSGQANKKNKLMLDGLEQENKSDFLKEYYRGALDNEGSKAYLKKLDNSMKEANKAVDNSAVATGATQENILAQKESNNRVMSDAVADLVTNEDLRKQQVKSNYFARRDSLQNGQMGVNASVGQNWANLGSGIANAAGGLAESYMDDKHFRKAR